MGNIATNAAAGAAEKAKEAKKKEEWLHHIIFY